MTAAYGGRERDLERALLFNFLVHGVALVGMALLLLPMMPGGGTTSDTLRAQLIAENPWRFRIGWMPWQLCALADLLLAVAMLRVRWLPRAASVFVLGCTLVAIVPDQLGEGLWVTEGIRLAQTDVPAYLAFEQRIFPLTAAYGAFFYTMAALGWTYAFARAGTWSRLLSVLSVPLWIAMTITALSPIAPESIRPGPKVVSGLNAVSFLALQLWLGLLTEAVFRRARPYEAYGRLARWRHPARGPIGRAFDLLANSRLFGAVLEPLPEVTMRSDITDVVYVNYLVPADEAAALLPPGLELQRLGPNGQWALFTFLTYVHGNFGFAFLGPLRKLMPSPIQTNWRIHVVDPENRDRRGIYFLTNAITHSVPALAARLTTEGMPMHVLHEAALTRRDDGLRISLDPGKGSAPDAEIDLRHGDVPVLEGAWAECWPDYRSFLAYCVPQDRAMSSQPLRGRISRQEIDLGIPLDACKPLTGTVRSRAAERLAGSAPPLCFHVANVSFMFSMEAHDRRGTRKDA